jgi:hypothetical protein
MYASQAWSGFLSQELIYRIDVFFRRVCKFGLCQHFYSFQYVANLRDMLLYLRKLCNLAIACIRYFLVLKQLKYTSSYRGHNFILPKNKQFYIVFTSRDFVQLH